MIKLEANKKTLFKYYDETQCLQKDSFFFCSHSKQIITDYYYFFNVFGGSSTNYHHAKLRHSQKSNNYVSRDRKTMRSLTATEGESN